jgi:hypothetical protein
LPAAALNQLHPPDRAKTENFQKNPNYESALRIMFNKLPDSRPLLPRIVPHAILLTIVALAATASLLIARAIPLPNGPDDYNAPGFVARHAWVKFAAVIVRPFRDDLSASEKQTRVARFFELNDLINYNERIAGDPETAPDLRTEALARAQAYRSERRDIENSVERILEGRMTDAIKRAGLTRHVGADIVWPPVNIEFEEPPSVLVKSPRAVIEKDSESLLKGDLPIGRVLSIESNAERDGKTSALVVEVGAIGTYPAIIPPLADYHATLEIIGHEWMHHYLYFTPLGRDYFAGGDLTTLNETVADFAGRELACLIDPCNAAARAGAAPERQEFDFTTEMRNLRRQVEALLADGKIDDAERLMEQKRQEFVANGYYIRRINQAYFAFHGSYADSPGSIDPIGPKLDQLRRKSATLEQFIETVRDFQSQSDLDASLR